jgi:SAM-dependent methyltransferase
VARLANAAALARGLSKPETRALVLQFLAALDQAPTLECPCCGYVGHFKPWGVPMLFDAQCPSCGSFERHRLFSLMQEQHNIVPADSEVLHFAPETSLRPLIEPNVARYQTADLRAEAADMTLNIEDIALPSDSVGLIVCSHVLEHVDDRKALPELFRILKPGGRAVLMVPIIEGWDQTYEDPSIVSESDRDRHFQQFDHVRLYGRDFRDRVRAAGFTLDEFTATGGEAVRHGLIRGERIFLASKPAA